MGAAAMDTNEGGIRFYHWELWAHLERGWMSPPNGYAMASTSKAVPSSREPTVYDRFPISPWDEEIAEQIGKGMRWLRTRDRRLWTAVRARFVAASDSVRMGELAKRWDVSPGRVSQMATDGQALVEQWVELRNG